MNKTRFLIGVIGLTSLTACSSIPFFGEDAPKSEASNQEESGFVPNFIKPFRVDIQQGNFVTEEDTSKLKIGMNKDQVRFILGTPLLQDPFHADRWDYPFRLLRADGSRVDARYTVIFENGALARHGGANLPANQADLLGQDKRNRREIEAKPLPSATLTTKESK